VSGTLVKDMSNILLVGNNNTAACKDGNGVETPSGWRYAVGVRVCAMPPPDVQSHAQLTSALQKHSWANGVA
jgi:hypothetical protein